MELPFEMGVDDGTGGAGYAPSGPARSPWSQCIAGRAYSLFSVRTFPCSSWWSWVRPALKVPSPNAKDILLVVGTHRGAEPATGGMHWATSDICSPGGVVAIGLPISVVVLLKTIELIKC